MWIQRLRLGKHGFRLLVFLRPFIEAGQVAKVAWLPQLIIEHDLGEEFGRPRYNDALSVVRHPADTEPICYSHGSHPFEPDLVISRYRIRCLNVGNPLEPIIAELQAAIVVVDAVKTASKEVGQKNAIGDM